MEISYRLRSVKARLFDAQTLFRFSATRTEDRLREAHYHWTDERARRFAQSRLQPQIAAMALNAELLRRMQLSCENAVTQSAMAESQLRHALGALSDFETEHAVAARSGHAANQAANSADAQARLALTQSREVDSGLIALGDPPI